MDESHDFGLKHLDLPISAIEYYHRHGFYKMFPWQRDCIRLPGVSSKFCKTTLEVLREIRLRNYKKSIYNIKLK